MITRYRGYDLQDFSSHAEGKVLIWLGDEYITSRPTVEEAKKEIDEWLHAK